MKKLIGYLVLIVCLISVANFVLAGMTPPPGIPTSFTTLLANIASGVGKFIAGLSAIMIIVSGIMFLLSAGDPGKMGTAKKALLYAIIGLIIGLSATGIVDYVKTIIGGTGTNNTGQQGK